MFKKLIILVLISLLVLTAATACSKATGEVEPPVTTATEQEPATTPATPATPSDEAEPASSPTPATTVSPEKDKDIPTFTVEEILVLANEDVATFQELIGKTIRVRGFINEISAGLVRVGTPKMYGLRWSIVLTEKDNVGRGLIQVVAKEKNAYFDNEREAKRLAPFLFDLVEKTSSWQIGDEVILEGELLEHVSFEEAVFQGIFATREGMIYLKIKNAEKVW